MTGYTVHTGTSLKFSSGWDRIFQGRKPAKSTASEPTAASATKKKASKKAVKKAVAVKKTSVKKAAATKSVKRGKSA
ncbi:hypothetical protein [Schlesneria paludicola]|uniref:hypothetical protein n=1 Tax=Schlesneria paludicola TaxID=360056 RepID=UPI00029A4AEC|nr:hypothetical protein [Schlesneria paludicola]